MLLAPRGDVDISDVFLHGVDEEESDVQGVSVVQLFAVQRGVLSRVHLPIDRHVDFRYSKRRMRELNLRIPVAHLLPAQDLRVSIDENFVEQRRRRLCLPPQLHFYVS